MTIELPVIHKLRTFIAAQGVALPPWSGLDETLSQLHDLLRQRRGDPEFWQPLAALLRDLAQGARQQGQLPAPGAELLSSWTREDIARALRSALPAEERGDPGAVAQYTRGLPLPLRTGFLLMGLAASGCSWHGTAQPDELPPADPVQQEPAEDESDPAQPEAAEAVRTDAVQQEPPADPPSLWEAIDGSSLDSSDKQQLRDCLAPRELDLARLFQTATPEQIAAVLEAELEACQEKEERSRYRRMEAIALYKGVTPTT